jgi:diguanylate cyclase (GGDEF)-like protein
MNSLFQVLTQQHREEFAPLRCNEQTMLRLARYFEDLVTENNLSALVIEGRCPNGHPLREPERLARVAATARRLYLFCCDGKCAVRTWEPETAARLMIIEEPGYHGLETGPFILVTEPRFCGLLASRVIDGEKDRGSTAYEVVWTFDPNVVFTAIEYLMARFGVQRPDQREGFESLLRSSTPASSSLRLALAFMTKLTVLMQRQNVLEMATNRISSVISSSLELESILQSTVEEVGGALKARRAALVLWQEGTSLPEGMTVYERPEEESPSTEMGGPAKENAIAPERSALELPASAGLLEVPVTYRDMIVGVLAVEDDLLGRNWEDEEVLMVKTVSDQLAVAISHARLFRQMQTQAMTDSLTGLDNHGCFQARLEHELRLADRHQHQVSLILLDLDQLKRINDTYGHVAGDAALCHVASSMRAVVREVDVCARYGGEEFCVILPRCSRDDALEVAERVREAIASIPVPRVGQVTASFGVATYPVDAQAKEDLVEMSDRAMYLAKAAGRNRVRTLMHRSISPVDVCTT